MASIHTYRHQCTISEGVIGQAGTNHLTDLKDHCDQDNMFI